MPIIFKITNDMFEFESAADYCVNLVNLMGVSGKGIALEMRNRCPSHIEKYREACRTQELRIGTIQIIDETEQDWGIINFPTKRHYSNLSSTEDIVRSLEALRDTLKTKEYQYSSIVMPIPGSGNGGKTYDEIMPLMIDWLSNLDATVFISLAPDKTEMRPKYLSVVGPADYGITDKDKQSIDWAIETALTKWGTDLSDYEGIISGGFPGVDTYIGGNHYLKDIEVTYAFKKTNKPGLVIKPNVHRNGVGAVRQAGQAICEAGQDIILFKPKGHNNNRMNTMQIWLENKNREDLQKGNTPKRVAVFGDRTLTRTDENVLIPLPNGD